MSPPLPEMPDTPATGVQQGDGPLVSTADLPRPPEQAISLPTIPGYRVLKLLGKGGMGAVFLAESLKLRRLVAIKMLLSAFPSTSEAERFLDEARAMAQVHHPHVVQIFELSEIPREGTAQRTPFFAMEYLPGGSLADQLTDEPVPPEEAAFLVEILAQALQAAHDKGLIHRDIKPGNILLDDQPNHPNQTRWGYPKVSDFGLVKWDQHEFIRSHTAHGCGTPAYMAPEQLKGSRERVKPSADVYALGGILYRLLVGEVPYQLPATRDISAKLAPPPSARETIPHLPEAIDRICQRCLQPDPAQRFVTARELENALRSFRLEQRIEPSTVVESPARQPVFVGDERTVTQVANPPNRNRSWVFALGLLLLTVSLGLWQPWKSPTVTQPVNPTRTEELQAKLDLFIYEAATEDVPRDPVTKEARFVPGNPKRQKIRFDEPGAVPLSPRDWIQVKAQVNRPAYLYLLWIDTEGEISPLYPWARYDWAIRPSEERPQVNLSIPSETGLKPLGRGPAGIETIVLLARETPLSAEEADRLKYFCTPMKRGPLPRIDYWLALQNGSESTDETSRGRPPSEVEAKLEHPEAQVKRFSTQLQTLFSTSRAVLLGNHGKN